MNETEQALKELIIEALNLEDLTPDDIETEAPLFGDGLGLDSIDALELGVAVRRKYGVNLDVDSEEIRDHFASVASLARFVTADSQ
jgi:acyl carrier protein